MSGNVAAAFGAEEMFVMRCKLAVGAQAGKDSAVGKQAVDRPAAEAASVGKHKAEVAIVGKQAEEDNTAVVGAC